MFCPNCGLENSQGQKFCRRCGANLLAVDLARGIVNEVSSGAAANQLEPNNILKITALFSILSFLFVTIGAIVVTIIEYTANPTEARHGPPIGLFLAMLGYTAIVLITRRLLKLLETTRNDARPYVMQPAFQPQPVQPAQAAMPPSQTNRNLGAAPVYHSITEQETQQFEHERRANS